MPKPIIWTAAADAAIKTMRADRLSWDHIAAHLGFARYTVIERGRELGVTQPERIDTHIDMDRGPLAAGDALSWGAINAGTTLDGAEYPGLVNVRVPVMAPVAIQEAA